MPPLRELCQVLVNNVSSCSQAPYNLKITFAVLSAIPACFVDHDKEGDDGCADSRDAGLLDLGSNNKTGGTVPWPLHQTR